MTKGRVNTLVEKQDKPELRKDQIEDLSFLIANKRAGLLSDPGTGKTPPVCMFFQYLWEYEDTKTVWVMPKSLLQKNRDEILAFTDFEPQHVQIIDGTPKKRQQQMENPEAVVFLMGFGRWRDDWQNFLELHPKIDCVVGDEVHLGWKSHDSKTGKQLLKAMKRIRRFVAMTGTLVSGRLDAAYLVVHIIEPRYYPTYWVFFNMHAVTDLDNRVVAWKNHGKLGAILARHCVRRRFEDIFGEQEVVEQKVHCEMTEAQREAYKQMEDEALVELEDSVLDGSLPGVNTIRCRQILAHPETMGIHKKGEPTGKDEQLLIDLEDHYRNSEPFVIFSALQPEQERIKRLAEEKGFKVGLINGNTSSNERNRVDQGFRKGDLDGIVASPATAAFGYNWSRTNHFIFVSRDYQDDSYEQAKRRGIRGKRTKPLRVSIYEYTHAKVDKRINQVIQGKKRDRQKVEEQVT